MKKILAAAWPSLFVLADAHAQQVGNHAELVSAQYPAAMEAGMSYRVDLVFANRGTTTWTSGTPASGRLYRIGDVEGAFWGVNRAFRALSADVPPQGTAPFSFTVTAPSHSSSKPLAYAFTWRMVQERVEFFGQTTPSAPPSQRIAVYYAPPLDASALETIAADAAPSLPAMGEFTFANFRGANVINRTFVEAGSHTEWIPTGADLAAVLSTAEAMKLNVLRLPVVIPPSTNFDSAQWGGVDARTATATVITKVRGFLNAANARQMKVIITLDGYTKYGYSGEASQCLWKKSFKDVEANAEQLVAAIKDYPALYAWDVLNEPLHNAAHFNCLNDAAGVASPDAYKSVVNAVHAMYNLIKRYDPVRITTVGEGNAAFQRYWRGISSFMSNHQYYSVQGPAPSGADLALMKNLVIGTYNTLPRRWSNRPWPAVNSEFGAIAPEQAQLQYDQYKTFLLAMKTVNAGSAFWTLSPRHGLRVNNSEAMACLVAGIQTSDNPVCPPPTFVPAG
nr:cellulase family glycosylhydrolase [uncultured Duganella sp.]